MSVKKIIKINNKDKNFYNYMGKFFGSRLVQNKLNDRIYDDAEKEWYILLENDKSIAFVAVVKNTIKNLYATSEEDLIFLLEKLKKDILIDESIVPNIYLEIYEKVGFKIIDKDKYKNFVLISK